MVSEVTKPQPQPTHPGHDRLKRTCVSFAKLTQVLRTAHAISKGNRHLRFGNFGNKLVLPYQPHKGKPADKLVTNRNSCVISKHADDVNTESQNVTARGG